LGGDGGERRQCRLLGSQTWAHTHPPRLELLLIHRMNVERQLEETTASLAAIDYKIGLYQERLSA
jgi:hypothetical protein